MSQVKLAFRKRLPRYIGDNVSAINHQGRSLPVAPISDQRHAAQTSAHNISKPAASRPGRGKSSARFFVQPSRSWRKLRYIRVRTMSAA